MFNKANNFSSQDAEFLVDLYGAFGKYLASHGQPSDAVRTHIMDYMFRNKLLPDEAMND